MATETKSNSAELLGKLQNLGSALIAYENDLWAFFSLSDDLFCAAEKAGRFLRVNPAWTRCLGWSQEEMTSRSWIEFVHPEDVDGTIAEAQAMTERNAVGFENRYRHKDGTWRNLLWTAQSWGADGKNYAVARDITKRREAEALIHELKDDRQLLNGKTDRIIELLRS